MPWGLKRFHESRQVHFVTFWNLSDAEDATGSRKAPLKRSLNGARSRGNSEALQVIAGANFPQVPQAIRSFERPHPYLIITAYLLTATVSLAPIAGTVLPTTAAIWRTCTISSSN